MIQQYTLLICLMICFQARTTVAQDTTHCIQFTFGFGHLRLGDQPVKYTFQPYARPAYEIVTRKNYQTFYPVLIHPRLNLWRMSRHGMSLNLSFPISLNFYGEVTTSNTPPVTGSRNFLLANIPYLLEYSIGRSAYCNCATDRQWGGFVAGGFSTIYGSGKIGSFNSTQPYVQAGIRAGMTGRLSLELSFGSGLVIPQSLDEVYYAEVRPIAGQDYTARKIAHTINLGLLLK